MTHFRKKLLCLCLAAMLTLSGCNATRGQKETEPTQAPSEDSISQVRDLMCLEISRFTGGFVEDGTYERVTDVAAILVANDTDQFLELATVTYRVGNRKATFRITGLPAGGMVWVLEQNRLTLAPEDQLVLEDCQASYNPKAITSTSDLQVIRDGNSYTVKNVSGKTLKNVCIYYKNTMDNGYFMGGITFMMTFGDMAPGEQIKRASAHLGDNSRIVRYGYQVE